MNRIEKKILSENIIIEKITSEIINYMPDGKDI